MIKEGFLKNCQVKEKIGTGNYGTVYLLEKNNEIEAMKVIDIYPKNTEQNLILGKSNKEELEDKTEKVMNEISILYSLKGNTHIVNYIDHYVEKSEDKYTLYLEMEYLHCLEEYYGKQVETKEILNICYDMLDALEVCEDNEIIHGDIKPQNIMVSQEGINKLTDFGISKIFNESSVVEGYTPAYAPPEVIHERKYSKQSDIYSLGLVIYQLFNEGLLPFMKKNFNEKDTKKIIEKRLNKNLPKPKNINKEFYQFLNKALEKDPDKRYQSAKEMKQELQTLEKENHIPKVALSLTTLVAVSLKLNQMNVIALAGNTTKAVNGLKALTLKSKVIIGTSATLVVGGSLYYVLNQKEEVNLSQNIQYEVEGVSQAGHIQVVENNVELKNSQIDMTKLIKGYEYSKNDNLKNGDKVTITVQYDKEYADENSLEIQNSKKEITIKGLSERYKNKNDIPKETIAVINEYALDKLFKEARYHSGNYYVYKKESDYKRKYNLNEETFEVVTSYLQKFKDNSSIKSDSYIILLREGYERNIGGGGIEMRLRYRIFIINDFYKGTIKTKDDVKKHSSDLITFNPSNRFPEQLALNAFQTTFDTQNYEYEEVKYYNNIGLNNEIDSLMSMGR